MVIEWGGQLLEFRFDDITVRQAMVIYRDTGLTLGALYTAMAKSTDDVRDTALTIVYWLVTGCTEPLLTLDFPLVKFARAVAVAVAEDVSRQDEIERREYGGMTKAESWAKRAAAVEAGGVSFAEAIEVKKYYQSFGEQQKWLDEWCNRSIADLRGQYLWDFGKVLRMNANDIDELRFSDFFNYCNALKQEREHNRREAAKSNNKTV